MITPELISYIRAEFAKGKTREEIRGALIGGGGWSEDDLSEAFRTVIPMQGMVPPAQAVQKPVAASSPAPVAAPVINPVISPIINPAPVPTVSIPPVTSPQPFSPTPSFTPPPSFSPPSPRSFSPPPSFSPPSLRTFSSSPSVLKQAPLSKISVPVPHHSSRSWLKFLVILIIIGGLGFGVWYYRIPIVGLWNSLINKFAGSPALEVETPSNPNLDQPAVIPLPSSEPPSPPVVSVKECGTAGKALKLDTPSAYENDTVLLCLGASALACESARATIPDDLFPTIFEITALSGASTSCNFKLSYAGDSALTDLAGKKLAFQFVSCPLDIVKTIDNTKSATPKFNAPNTTNLSKYAANIYFYGTLGLFVENNLDLAKIQSLGCSGEYIQTVIASYNAKK